MNSVVVRDSTRGKPPEGGLVNWLPYGLDGGGGVRPSAWRVVVLTARRACSWASSESEGGSPISAVVGVFMVLEGDGAYGRVDVW